MAGAQCSEPRLAKLVVGQRWVPSRPRSRAAPRTVVWVEPRHPTLAWVDYATVGYVRNPAAPEYPETGHDSWLSRTGFRAWIRKHAAHVETSAPRETTVKAGSQPSQA